MLRYLLPILFVSFCLSCEPTTPATEQESSPAPTTSTPDPDSSATSNPHSKPTSLYSFNQPQATFELSASLKEISGLSLAPQVDYLMAINDEKGQVFFIDQADGSIKEQLKFGKAADYEGVEWVNGPIYIIQSSGTINEIKNPTAKKIKTKKYKNFLNTQNDVEGLAYDAKNKRLLLACKGHQKEEDPDTKHIYGFDLAKKELIETPAYSISRAQILAFLDQQASDAATAELKALFQSKMPFSPSAIAIHPKTDQLYISSSVGKLLLILDPNNRIVQIERLDRKVHLQPEGLCFEPDGTLWISDEGKNGKAARLHRYAYASE